MKVQLIHLSDIHFENKNQPFEIKIDKMIQAIDSVDCADECVIVVSGDLADKGYPNQYRYVSSLLGALLKNLGQKNFAGKTIGLICVPGNHDIDFTDMKISFEDIQTAYKENKITELIDEYLKHMNGFWGFARYRKCFLEDNIVSKKIISYGSQSIGFVMLNTAPLSLKDGNAQDMGNHYLSDEQLDMLEQATGADVNVLVMHHSIEWFRSGCKERLRKIISQKYALVLTGHEHEPVGETRNVNGKGEFLCIQGNALYGYAAEGNGFCTVNIDFQNNFMTGYSYIWEKDVYVPKKILDSVIKFCGGNDLNLKQEFLQEIDYDSSRRKIADFYVFPGLTYNTFTEDEELEKHDVETENDLFELISKYNKVVISGEHKAGKTILAKRLYKRMLEQGKTVLLINASDINRKKVERTVKYAFDEQYETDNNAYVKFNQIKTLEKVVILDEAHLLVDRTFDLLLKFLERDFGQIIIFSEDRMALDIRKQVVDVMVEEDSLQLTIKPFLYVKRKELISNVLSCNHEQSFDIEKETNKINDLINVQVKYFQLNPEFIISFVNQYERDYKFQFSSGMNVFNIVYESSIKNRIIANAKDIDVTSVINVLMELAYFMHFQKRSYAKLVEVSEVINRYNKTYRQKVNVRSFLNATLAAKVLVENGNEFRFRDHTLVAYFVARAINHKYNQDEDIQDDFNYLLRYLCFNINSDIVLFLALITDNPKFVNVVMQGAEAHFANQEELSFDKGNVEFLNNIAVPVKNTVPNQKERQLRETAIAQQEEEVKLSELVELVNEYDYTEEDLEKIENQVMISYKYLEILSKALPAFCQNMKVEQQDKLVSLVYRCPNQFLYLLLKDIGENFEQVCEELYEEVSLMRKEKNIVDVNVESVKRIVEQISAALVVVIYQMIATTCVSEQSIEALNEFDYSTDSNHQLQNLMMLSRVGHISLFAKKARELDGVMDNKLAKSIIKYTVREYFLRNNVEIYGEAQSLLEHFFGGKGNKQLQMEIARKRLTQKDRT